MLMCKSELLVGSSHIHQCRCATSPLLACTSQSGSHLHSHTFKSGHSADRLTRPLGQLRRCSCHRVRGLLVHGQSMQASSTSCQTSERRYCHGDHGDQHGMHCWVQPEHSRSIGSLTRRSHQQGGLRWFGTTSSGTATSETSTTNHQPEHCCTTAAGLAALQVTAMTPPPRAINTAGPAGTHTNVRHVPFQLGP